MNVTQSNINDTHLRKLAAFIFGLAAGACGVGGALSSFQILFLPAAVTLVVGIILVGVPETWV